MRKANQAPDKAKQGQQYSLLNNANMGLKRFVLSVLARFGLTIHRSAAYSAKQLDANYAALHLMQSNARRLQIMKAQQIDLVLDVGANTGQYAHGLRNSGYMEGIVSFEPLLQAFQVLEAESRSDPLWSCEQIALGASEGSFPLHIAGNLESSSFLAMSQAHIDNFPESAYVATEEAKMTSLDSIFDRVTVNKNHIYLKLDVQGYELNVLHGARRSLAHIKVIEIEILLSSLYAHQPTTHEIFLFFHDAGFDAVSLENGYTQKATGYMLWIDGIFVRRDKAFHDD